MTERGGASRRVVLASFGVVAVASCGLLGGGYDLGPWRPYYARTSADGRRTALYGFRQDGVSAHLLTTQVAVADGKAFGDPVPVPGVVHDFAWMPDGRLLVAYQEDDLEGSPVRIGAFSTEGELVWAAGGDVGIAGTAGMAVSPDGRLGLVSAATDDDRAFRPALVDLRRRRVVAPRSGVGPFDITEPAPWSARSFLFVGSVPVSASMGNNGWIGILDVVEWSFRRLTSEALVAFSPSRRSADEVVFSASLGPHGVPSLYSVHPSGRSAPEVLSGRSVSEPWVIPGTDRLLGLASESSFGFGRLVEVEISR